MAAGRPKKPNHIKEAQGTLEKSRINDRPIDYGCLSAIPTPPEILDNDGKGFYTYVCGLLLSKKLLSAAYLLDIERAATWHSIYKICQRKIYNGEIFVVANSGWEAKGGAVQLLSDATKFLNDFDNRYGLNLVAGQKIEMPEIFNEPEY